MKHPKTASAVRWFIVLLCIFTHSRPADGGPLPNPKPMENFWVTDGTVLSLMEANGLLYMGGNFTHVGPNTGKGVVLPDAGESADLDWPRITAAVYAAVPDGFGGWYVGGGTYEDDEPNPHGGRSRILLSHMTNDRLFDEDFDFRPGGDIYALLRSGDTLYVSGNFIDIDDISRNYIAAIDLTTGQLSTWNPGANFYVYAMALSGSTLYIGGSFTTAGGQSRNGLAAINVNNGTVQAFPHLDDGGSVHALHVNGNVLYVGGRFEKIGGLSRHNLAAIDLTSGDVLTGFNAGAFAAVLETRVSTITTVNGKLYVGGSFDSVGGFPSDHLAVLNAATGSNLNVDFDVYTGSSANVISLASIGNTLYVGGYFFEFAEEERLHLAAVDTTTDQITSWDPRVALGPVNGQLVHCISSAGDDLFVGGNFHTIGAVPRRNLAAFSTASGQATSWAPNPDGTVDCFARHGNNIYMGGQFTKMDGEFRDFIAGFDVNGELLPFAPDIFYAGFRGVYALLVDGDHLYAGGAFEVDVNQGNLVKYDLTTGNLMAWDADVAGTVYALGKNGNTLYVGGGFASVGGQTRNNLASVSADTAAVTSWDPDVSNAVYALALGLGDTVYAGGGFTSVGGEVRHGLAAISKTTGDPTSWNPLTSAATVRALDLSDTHLSVAGGSVYRFGTLERGYYAVINAFSGSARSLDLQIQPSTIFAIHRGERNFYLGGNQAGTGYDVRPTLSAHKLSPYLHRPTKQVDGSYTLFFDILQNVEYALEYSSNLVDWFEVDTVENITSKNDASSIGQPARMYRLRELEDE